HQSRAGPAVTVRLLTNIGRLWTGSEILSNAAIVTGDDRIAWVGPAAELPQRIPGVVDDIVDVDHVENLGGGLVTPGLIDAHTHPVYAGNRWAELAMRSNGSSAAEIAAAGGGVASTVTVTRGTDPWALCNGVRARLGRGPPFGPAAAAARLRGLPHRRGRAGRRAGLRLRRHPARGHRGGRRGAGPGWRGRRGLPQPGPADQRPAASARPAGQGRRGRA